MKKILLAIILFVILLATGAVFSFFIPKEIFGSAKIEINGAVLDVEVAETPLARSRGLSYREELKDGSGMLFIFDDPGVYGFWMKGMKFPIDIVWISGNEIVAVEENVAPDNGDALYYPPEPVNRVLEIGAGAAKRLKIQDKGKITVIF
ncbi:MAG: hypothetical protein A3I89_01820 [Candidatus Harrisonbacteria bacterium RIFCSPLOWO2_02_FULL_41_11]|uniref:DUF192 domain-containing protein n=1 Tax=Candidatus Harrisonbacteria bacterium RIFCSPHIGHO2_02_FULL_42_16 TaxID=1798404 RepID=A0A1G1ZHD4_9BACT|nr:MAG: hypothetical protein A3B92_01990 [Candidatus Harrisonbacteria bacterium RIFCSPHIGHO2_02_FULL_42_16]OGY65602.1 MAG: hypothetical protein A3I89_01820 [Candidatus Harrisonbacteria bacterium RIFCSPLOWO2_02_FULL_41_11]